MEVTKYLKEIYTQAEYTISKTDDGFCIVNNRMTDFAHTHVKNLKSAKWLVELSISKKCPYDISKYFVESLIRINHDEKYLRKLNEILLKKKCNKDYYFNPNKGRR